jgi:YVTN family beta-propeller protein
MNFDKFWIQGVAIMSSLVLIIELAPAQTPSPILLVVNRGENSLALIDLQSRKTLGTVPTGEGAHGLAVSADGKLAFVTNTYTARSGGKVVSPSISVIDVAARKELRRVQIGPFSRPHGIFVGGGKVYFTAEGYKAIGCYDPTSNQVEWLLGNGQDRTTLIVANNDVTQIFGGNVASNSVTAMERVSDPAQWKVGVDWKVTNILVGKGPHGIDLSPDGKEVWTANEFDGTVSIVDVATKKLTQTLNLQTKNANRLDFTHDGKRVLILDDEGLLVLDAAARKPIKRVKVGEHPQETLLAPDGLQAFVAVADEHAIAIVDLKTLEVTGHIPTGKNPEGMAWVASK